MMISRKLALMLCMAAVVAAGFSTAKAAEPWVGEMTTVHSRFPTTGAYGTVARFGDSLTYSAAFFMPLSPIGDPFQGTTAADDAALAWLSSFMSSSCWGWQGDAVAELNGCYSGKTSAWPLETTQAPPAKNITTWLNNLKPEIAVIMFGTNDVTPGNNIDVATYKSNMRTIVMACKTFGTIPVLTTIPPRVGFEAQTVGDSNYPSSFPAVRGTYVQAIIDLAAELKVPLIDLNGEILTRRPTIWSNTLIAADGIHLSNNTSYTRWFDEARLNTYGYILRNWLTLHALYAIQQNVLANFPAHGPKMSVTDIAASDVPGPQPIRKFPVPAAAGWANPRIIYDNWAEGLVFSTVWGPPYDSWLAMPKSNSNVTIHRLKNLPASPVDADFWIIQDTANEIYVTAEGSDADARANNRFPYHIPRMAQRADWNFLAFELDLAAPAEKVGMFLPTSSNNWGNTPPNDDQNFLTQKHSVYVTVLDDSGAVYQRYVSLRVNNTDTYCPFLAIEWDGTHKISKVSVVHNHFEGNQGRSVSLMDIYVDAPLLVGDINGDGFVNVGDLQALVAAWGSQKTPPSANWNAGADINGDGFVNVGDLQLLVAHWGEHR